MKAVIYTAIYGGFDDLKPQPVQCIPCDFVCFTDCDITSNQWNIVKRDFPGITPRMKAKFPKCFYSSVLPGYDIYYWIDGGVTLKSENSLQRLIDIMGDNDNLFFNHPDRYCIIDEAEVSLGMYKYRGHSLREQVNRYLAEGYPRNNGLYACTTILRRKSENNDKMALYWYNEINDDLIQDQISLPFIVWKYGLKINGVDIDLRNNEFIQWGGHKDNRID